ncbi:YvcK family protein [Candidatus Roizmanbacteria bacterium]|nr:YvcK family protein [Candidatus Roizmanbacteria bacterium]
MDGRSIVCLGGGIGTVNLIRGLRDYFKDISVVVSLADDGGSAGRLRRLYNIPPPGDLVSCMTALIKKDSPNLEKLLMYRFKGDRYGKDKELGGQKLGNLILTAMLDITGNFEKAIELFKNTFDISGNFLPATTKAVSISARTIEGKIINGEEKIDRGQYRGKRILERVYLHPKDAEVNPLFIESLKRGDIIVIGPGDLYTTILPVLIVEGIKEILIKSKALKIFVVNVTNKPFETKGYNVRDYILAIKRHLNMFPIDKVIINNNFSPIIPQKLNYKYVNINGVKDSYNLKIIQEDLVDEKFPLYHNPQKLAKTIIENV